MRKKFKYFIVFQLIVLVFYSCVEDDGDDYVPVSPVNYDIDRMPYDTLTEYVFFEDEKLSELDPVYGVLPFKPISGLFTDYAKKKRFIWMPNDVKANYSNDYSILDFPVGTILIKNFYYNNVFPDNNKKILETRLMIKKEAGWVFATYVWNQDQTEAFLDMDGSVINVKWEEDGEMKNTDYRIPSREECLTCHKVSLVPTPIGVKPQNLNSIYNYGDEEVNQLEKLVSFGYLNSIETSGINTLVNWSDSSQPLDLRARSYLDINCAHCHSDNTHCSYRPIRFAFNDTENPENLGICMVPDEEVDPTLSHIVSPGRSERSVISYRLRSTNESIRMPLIGREIPHDEGIQLIEEWINSLTTVCD